jgi:hypothetical protein
VMNERDELRERLEAEMRKPITVLSFDGQAQIDSLRIQCSELYADRERLLREAKAYHDHMAKWEAQTKADAAALADSKPEPAERKPHDGRVYGPRGATLDEMEAGACTLHTKDALAHLREVLDERKAIEALADEWEHRMPGWGEASTRLRGVLNGKR